MTYTHSQSLESIKAHSDASWSLWLGVASLLGWIIPIVGFTLAVGGIVQSMNGWQSDRHGRAVAGLTLSLIGLTLSVVSIAIGASALFGFDMSEIFFY